MSSWQLQEAKAQLSKVIATAKAEGPQVITKRGIETVVIVSMDQWKRVKGIASEPKREVKAGQTTEDLLAFLRSAPAFDIPDRHTERTSKRKTRS